MKKVTLEEKMSIKELIEKGKTYQEISELLGIGFYAVRKWGRIIKKKDVYLLQWDVQRQVR